MASGIVATLQQVGAALGVAVVGILFGEALASGSDTSSHAHLYASAFVSGMAYNLVAAAIAAVLIFGLVPRR